MHDWLEESLRGCDSRGWHSRPSGAIVAAWGKEELGATGSVGERSGSEWRTAHLVSSRSKPMARIQAPILPRTRSKRGELEAALGDGFWKTSHTCIQLTRQ